MSDLRAALVAIQELHKPIDPVFSWTEGLQLREPCPDCKGKAGMHECGCWADRDIQYVCAECSDFEHGKGRRVTYPCPTRRLADEALTARTTKNGDNK